MPTGGPLSHFPALARVLAWDVGAAILAVRSKPRTPSIVARTTCPRRKTRPRHIRDTVDVRRLRCDSTSGLAGRTATAVLDQHLERAAHLTLPEGARRRSRRRHPTGGTLLTQLAGTCRGKPAAAVPS